MNHIVLCFFLLITACVSNKQGIEGKVMWVSGNQMPGPEKPDNPAKGIIREIHIYEVALIENNPSEGGFFPQINSKFVAKGISQPDGTFKLSLPEGEYSVFTKEEKGLFANTFDGEGKISPIQVKKGQFSEITITVNYEAAY